MKINGGPLILPHRQWSVDDDFDFESWMMLRLYPGFTFEDLKELTEPRFKGFGS